MITLFWSYRIGTKKYMETPISHEIRYPLKANHHTKPRRLRLPPPAGQIGNIQTPSKLGEGVGTMFYNLYELHLNLKSYRIIRVQCSPPNFSAIQLNMRSSPQRNPLTEKKNHWFSYNKSKPHGVF